MEIEDFIFILKLNHNAIINVMTSQIQYKCKYNISIY